VGGERARAGQRGQVHAEDAMKVAANIEAGLVALGLAGRRCGRRRLGEAFPRDGTSRDLPNF
jgi:hypothetical protein